MRRVVRARFACGGREGRSSRRVADHLTSWVMQGVRGERTVRGRESVVMWHGGGHCQSLAASGNAPLPDGVASYRQWRAHHRGRAVFKGAPAHLTDGPDCSLVLGVLAKSALPVAQEPAAPPPLSPTPLETKSTPLGARPTSPSTR